MFLERAKISVSGSTRAWRKAAAAFQRSPVDPLVGQKVHARFHPLEIHPQTPPHPPARLLRWFGETPRFLRLND